MTWVAVQPFTGTFEALAEPSTVAFAVRHSGVFSFRGTLPDVAATLRGGADGGLQLDGSARIESISVTQPDALRASLLGPEFFDAEHHPEMAFRSAAIHLDDDGRALVEGDLTIRGITRPVTAHGTYSAPRESSFGEIAGLQLSATFDRREFGFNWQMPMPGGEVVGWDVTAAIDLLLKRADG